MIRISTVSRFSSEGGLIFRNRRFKSSPRNEINLIYCFPRGCMPPGKDLTTKKTSYEPK
jgi:hypothetical protein